MMLRPAHRPHLAGRSGARALAGLGVALALVLARPDAVAAQAPTGPPYDFLRSQIGLGDEALAALADGRAVTRAIDTPERREVAMAGSVRIRASTAFFLRMFRAIESFDTAARVSGELSDPPVIADFDELRIPPDVLSELAECRPGSCDMKLGATTIERMSDEVDWSAADAGAQAEAILREGALQAAIAYRSGGHRALGNYRDKGQPQRIAEDFEALLANAPYVLSYRPELHRYLVDYPAATLEGATDFLYWGEYDYGRPVLRLNHVTIHPAGSDENAPATIAVKHLWYTHYFTTGLALHVLVPDERSQGDAFYLVSLSRLRTDGVGGMFGGVLKRRVEGDVLKGFQAYLETLKAAVERYYAAEAAR